MPKPPPRLLDDLAADVVESIKWGVLRLRPSELDILREWMNGGTSHKVAERLGISHRTVEVHLRNIRLKCRCWDWALLMRALVALNDDPEVIAYVASRLPPAKAKLGRAKAASHGKQLSRPLAS